MEWRAAVLELKQAPASAPVDFCPFSSQNWWRGWTRSRRSAVVELVSRAVLRCRCRRGHQHLLMPVATPVLTPVLSGSVKTYPPNQMFGSREIIDGKVQDYVWKASVSILFYFHKNDPVEFIIDHAEVSIAFFQEKRINSEVQWQWET